MKRSQWFLVLAAVGMLGASGCSDKGTNMITAPPPPTVVSVAPPVTPRVTTPIPCPEPNKFHEQC